MTPFNPNAKSRGRDSRVAAGALFFAEEYTLEEARRGEK